MMMLMLLVLLLLLLLLLLLDGEAHTRGYIIEIGGASMLRFEASPTRDSQVAIALAPGFVGATSIACETARRTKAGSTCL